MIVDSHFELRLNVGNGNGRRKSARQSSVSLSFILSSFCRKCYSLLILLQRKTPMDMFTILCAQVLPFLQHYKLIRINVSLNHPFGVQSTFISFAQHTLSCHCSIFFLLLLHEMSNREKSNSILDGCNLCNSVTWHAIAGSDWKLSVYRLVI